MNVKDAWIKPVKEPIPFHREVPLWELQQVTDVVTDDDYRTGVYWDLGDLFNG